MCQRKCVHPKRIVSRVNRVGISEVFNLTCMSLDMNIKRKEQSKIQVMSPLRSFMSPGFHVLVLYVHKENKLKEVFKQLEK